MENETNATTPKLIWTTTDPNGRKVQLKDLTFNQHVIIDNNRREFIGEEETVRQTVTNPRYIYKDETHPNRVKYGEMQVLKELEGAHWIEVCVEDTATRDVVTIMARRNIGRIKGILYDSKNSNT